MEEGEGRKRGRKLLAKMMRSSVTDAFVGSQDKKGQGRFLMKRDKTRTRTIVANERTRRREKDKKKITMMNTRYS